MHRDFAALLALLSLLLVACANTPENVRGANEAAQTGATAEPGNRTKFGTEFGPISTFDLREGDCFNSSTSITDPYEVLLVSCEGFWEFQVQNHVPVPPDVEEWPGDDYFIRQSQEECSLTTVLVFYPSEDTWFLGDRSLYCMRGP